MLSYYKDRPDYLENVSILAGSPEPSTSFMYVLEKYVLPNVQDEQIKDLLKNFMLLQKEAPPLRREFYGKNLRCRWGRMSRL